VTLLNVIYQCPVCSEPLQRDERLWRCDNNHAFDIAREGYVNLLLAHQKKSKNAGDSKMMVDCRRRFLNEGFYDPLPSAITHQLAQYFPDVTYRLLDIGCGEGYYTNQLRQQQPHCQLWGVDISKPAVAAASKRYRDIEFFVASNYQLPILDNSVEVALKVYAPGYLHEINRVVKEGGYFISVIPGKNHLHELKSIIYDTPKFHDEQEPVAPGFSAIDRIELSDMISIDNSQSIQDLLAMTPYYWHIPESRQQAVADLESLKCQIHFIINIYQKNLEE